VYQSPSTEYQEQVTFFEHSLESREGVSGRHIWETGRLSLEHGLSQGAFDTALESVKEKWNNMERSCQVAECDP